MVIYGTFVTTHTSTTSTFENESLNEAIADMHRALNLPVREIYRDETRVIFVREPFQGMPEGLVIISK